ncbi:hypothetical protein IFR05_016767 [Cadophora sp. M221]|nr:hypothetical protein IFR05_016767 [Cadophora sp. M221]
MNKQANISENETLKPPEYPGLYILSLDGGGVRGLSILYILRDLFARLNIKRKKDGLNQVKPYHIFDLIGGTGTGGLIAIMLGRLEMDVDQCIDAYIRSTSEAFVEKSSFKWWPTRKVKPRFDSAKLEEAISQVIQRKDTLFNDGTKPCKTFVCAVNHATSGITRFRSYSSPSELDIWKPTIVQAALATTATTTLFEPVKIGNCLFSSGVLGANNPVEEVEREAANIWCEETGDLKLFVKCLISIGTGMGDPTKQKDGQTLWEIVTDTERTAEKFKRRWRKQKYFRLNVDQGLEVEPNEYAKQSTIVAATANYLNTTATGLVAECVQILGKKLV